MDPDHDRRAAQLLKVARRLGLRSQRQVARPAGVSQEMFSAYERAARQPSLRTLGRLLEPLDLDFELTLHLVPSGLRSLRRPAGVVVRRHRFEISALAQGFALGEASLVGAVACDETPGEGEWIDEAGFDVSFLVPHTYWPRPRFAEALDELLGMKVQVCVEPQEGLPPDHPWLGTVTPLLTDDPRWVPRVVPPPPWYERCE